MTTVLAFLKRDASIRMSYRLSFLFQFGGIIVGVATFYFVAKVFGHAAGPAVAEYGGDYFSFVLIGIAFSGYNSVALSSLATSIREGQTTGTLETMLVTPTPLGSILVCSALWDYLWNSLRVAIYLLLGVLIFGADLSHANPLSALLVLILSISSFSSIGFLSAGFILVLKRGDPVAWVYTTLSTLLAGVYYPTTILPNVLQWLSAAFPLTYSIRAMRLAMLQGYTPLALQTELAALLAFTVVLLPLSLWAFKAVAVPQAKKEGSLAHY